MKSESDVDRSLRVDREPIYFQEGRSVFFGWYHTANCELQSDCVAVICSPIGYEYVHSHRSIRHLADSLAKHGIPTVRFDYHGVGDSPGTDMDADRWRCWQDNIKTAIQHARKLAGGKRVCLLGIRLGATLAAVVASDIQVDLLVLWNPCVSGRRYLREVQAIAMTADGFIADADGILESAGFMMSAETFAALRSVDLLSLTFRVTQRTLLVGRDDLSQEQHLAQHFAATGLPHDCVTVSGYAPMMAEPQFTEIPETAFSTIIDWLAKFTERRLDVLPSNTRSIDVVKFPFGGEHNDITTIDEQFCRFGVDQHLFGILSRTTGATNFPAIIFFNAGAVHHVGPNRLYVTLARSLAAIGFACFRFDLEGIGDSVPRSDAGRDNHPYPDTAISDAQAALSYLKEQFGYTHFIALGLCSGAHTAFHAGLTFEKERLPELVLINPLTFYWVEGMSLETTRHFQDVLHYKKSARNLDSWRKLLRGKVDVLNLGRVALSHVGTLGRSYYNVLCEMFMPESGSVLSQDLGKLLAMNRTFTMIISEGDPGRDILMTGARKIVSKAQKANKIRLLTIEGADHTFTQFKARIELVRRLTEMLIRQYGKPGKSP